MKILVTLIYLLMLILIIRGESLESDSREEKGVIKISSTSSEEKPSLIQVSKWVGNVFDISGTLKRTFAVVAVIQDTRINTICSPLSALLPLGKLLLGASGRAERELLAAIGLTNTDEVKSYFKNVLRDLRYLPDVRLDIASRIYADTKLKISKRYQKKAKSIFKSSIKNIKMTKPQRAADTINEWVSKQTKGMIKGLINRNELSSKTSLVLVNAVYFQGSWETPFRSVSMDTFIGATSTRRIPMMSLEKTLKFHQNDILNAQILEIPYAGDGSAFILVLPLKKDGLPMLLRQLKLAPELLVASVTAMTPRYINITLPKFKITSQHDLKDLYKQIGLHNIFESNSDLRDIVKYENVMVSQAIQKAVIEVNEVGTKAAASSGLEIVPVMKRISFPVIANCPFYFFIKVGKQQLFAGTFVEP